MEIVTGASALGAQYLERLPRAERREFGKFYTPPAIVDFILERVGWTARHDILGRRIADLSCGCGAFLVPAAEALTERIHAKEPDLDLAAALSESIWGFDIDGQALRVCKKRLQTCAAETTRPVGSCFEADVVSCVCRPSPGGSPQLALPGTEMPRFDFVVGNPPYAQTFDAERKEMLDLFDSTRGNLDLHAAFVEIGLRNLADDGRLGYLVPNSFLTGANYAKLRERLLESGKTIRVFDFGPQQVFASAAVHCAVLIAEPPREKRRVAYCEARLERSAVRKGRAKTLAAPLFLKGASLTGGDRLIARIVRRSTHTLGDVLDTKDVGINYSTAGRKKVRDASIPSKILYGGERRNPADHPVIRGRDIERYSVRFGGVWLRHDYRDLLARAESVSMGESHFSSYEKIVSRQTADSIVAAIDRKQFWCARTVHIGLQKRDEWPLQLVLAFMNSSVSTYFYRAMSGEEGRVFPQVKIGKLREIPLVEPDSCVKSQIVGLVSEIEATGSRRAHADLTEVLSEVWGLPVPVRESRRSPPEPPETDRASRLAMRSPSPRSCER
jgi:predicted RNA methylase